jgi:hypothetical protein
VKKFGGKVSSGVGIALGVSFDFPHQTPICCERVARSIGQNKVVVSPKLDCGNQPAATSRLER